MLSTNHFLRFLPILLLSACSLGVSKQEIQKSGIKQEGVVLNKNYQALLKCWDDNAEKTILHTDHGPTSQIYPELGIAEMSVTIEGKYYFLLFQLKSLKPNQTVVNAYGIDWIGKTYLPQWMATLRECATQ